MAMEGPCTREAAGRGTPVGLLAHRSPGLVVIRTLAAVIAVCTVGGGPLIHL